MKKRYLLIGMLSSALVVRAQQPDSIFQKKIIPETDVQLLFSYYTQNGDHSAVTGGIGTEKLSVYAPNISMVHSAARSTWKADGGVDFISSASTDNIDFVMSSASKNDARIYAHGGYSRIFPKEHLEIGGQTGFSIESDYFSVPVILNASYQEPSKQRMYSVALEGYFDDLRWGRLNPDYYRPVKLIYPVELRYKDWYDEYRRYTYNLKLSFSQVINQRMIAGIFPELSYQHGLLATPFHRVYFNNDSLKVENLPDDRFKIPVGFRLNYFAGARTILRGEYDFYYDTWGILANAFQLNVAIKLNPKFTLTPFARIYHQSGAKYFKPYQEHDFTEKYYTSDYDLSRLTSYKFGAGFRYAPNIAAGKSFLFNAMELRYSAYFQSTKLHAQSLTFLADVNFAGASKNP